MFNIQEQEERDYNPQSELRNAFDWSCMTREPNDPRIAQELAKGRCVVVIVATMYCPSTDACMGEREDFHSAYVTPEAALQTADAVNQRLGVYGGSDVFARVRGLPVNVVAAEAACDCGDIPF